MRRAPRVDGSNENPPPPRFHVHKSNSIGVGGEHHIPGIAICREGNGNGPTDLTCIRKQSQLRVQSPGRFGRGLKDKGRLVRPERARLGQEAP